MAVVTTNLGVITAYGDAVAAGYTGTKAEWQALMANYATVGQQAAQDAQTASQAAQTATTKAGEASQSATRAENAAASITTPDATLTQAGVAADAKATGDEISDLKSGLQDLDGEVVKTVNGVAPDANGNVNVSGGGSDTELREYVDEIAEATTTAVSSTGDLTQVASETKKTLSLSGNVNDSTLTNQIVRAYAIPSDADSVIFNSASRASGENVWAIYSTDVYSECSANTVLASGTYTAFTDKEITEINGAKLLLIGAKAYYKAQYTSAQIVSKAATNVAEAYSTDKVYFVGDYCSYDGDIYKRTTFTGTVEEWDSAKWEKVAIADKLKALEAETTALSQSFPTSLFQKGKVNNVGDVVSSTYQLVMTDLYHIAETTVIEIAEGYTCKIYYYVNGAMTSNNGGLTSIGSRTILPDSYVRLVIEKTGDYSAIADNMIPVFVSKVTFATDKAKQDADIQTGVEGAMDALCAQMYQKGSAPTTFAKRPCIIVAGQSNIDGRVPVADLPSDITMPLSNIMVANASGVFSAYNVTSLWDITTSMFAELNKIGSTFYDIKYAVGGTSISEYGDSANHWTPFYENISGGLSKSLLLTFENKIRTTIGANPDTFDIRAFVWQQGEGDRSATSKQASLSYYKNFKCLVAYVRGIVGNEKLPVICGTVSHLSGQYDPVVEEATLRVAEEDPYMTCIDMSGAGLLDSFHFNADSAVYFGRMAYDALIDFGVITGTKINPTRPW